MQRDTQNDTTAETAAAEHIVQNVEAVSALYERAEHGINRHQRGTERLTAWLARPRVLYLLLVAAFLWMGANLLAVALGHRAVDPPPFEGMQGLVGLSSLLLATSILITQRGQGRLADTRAHLDLQINLLAEKKIAKLIELVEELRRDLPSVRDRYDAEAAAMQRPADPQRVIDALANRMEGTERPGEDSTNPKAARDQATEDQQASTVPRTRS